MEYTYEAKVVRVIDGDTVVLRLEKEFPLEVDFGFRIKDRIVLQKSTEMSFRLVGIDTPEVVGEAKAAGLRAKEALQVLLASGPIRAVTYKPDKYGRWLVDLYVKPMEGRAPEVRVNKEMIKLGHAVEYNP